MKKWSDKELEILRREYQRGGTEAVNAALRFELGYELTLSRIYAKAFKLKLNAPPNKPKQFFSKGHKTNIGRKYSNHVDFVPGTVRLHELHGKKIWRIKVAEGWQNLHICRWVQKNGPVPEDFKLVSVDGDFNNTAPENYKLVLARDMIYNALKAEGIDNSSFERAKNRHGGVMGAILNGWSPPSLR